MFAFMKPRQQNMAATYEIGMNIDRDSVHGARCLDGPGTCRVHDSAGLKHQAPASIKVGRLNAPMIQFALGAIEARTRHDGRTGPLSRQHICDHETRVINAAIRVSKGFAEFVTEAHAAVPARQVNPFGPRQHLAPRKMVIEKQSRANFPCRMAIPDHRHYETNRPDEMGRALHQRFSFGQRFPHKAKVVIFEVAKPTMNQLAGT